MGIKTLLGKLFSRSKDGNLPYQQEGNRGKQNGEGAEIVCADCRNKFLFEEGEQKFYKMRGLTPPKRCPDCRSKRKHQRHHR